MRIAMPRGDIKLVRFLVNDRNGTGTDIDFTEIYFTVKRTTKDRLYEFQKRLSTGGIIKLGLGDYQIKIEQFYISLKHFVKFALIPSPFEDAFYVTK